MQLILTTPRLKKMEVHTFSSVIRGHHIYKETWKAYIDEELITGCEEENVFDRHAAALLKNGEVVGHMPRTIARCSMFLVLKKR